MKVPFLTPTLTPNSLAERWRADAETLERYEDFRTGKVLRGCADDLEMAMRSVAGEALSLKEAARESGYSADRLGHMIAEGLIPNAGRKGSPRIRRGDLPRKNKTAGAFDPAAKARELVFGSALKDVR